MLLETGGFQPSLLWESASTAAGRVVTRFCLRCNTGLRHSLAPQHLCEDPVTTSAAPSPRDSALRPKHRSRGRGGCGQPRGEALAGRSPGCCSTLLPLEPEPGQAAAPAHPGMAVAAGLFLQHFHLLWPLRVPEMLP